MKVISGAQTGADQGGLLAAMDLSVPVGGYIPKGWLTERGVDTVPAVFRPFLKQAMTSNYSERTRYNVQAAQLTVLFRADELTPGCSLTEEACRHFGKPLATVEMVPLNWDNAESDAMSRDFEVQRIAERIVRNHFEVINITGHRESMAPGIQEWVRAFVRDMLQHVGEKRRTLDRG